MNREPTTPGWLPPEWAPQDAVMLTWPHESADWWRWLDQVDRAFAAIAREVTRRQRLLVTVRDAAHETRVRSAIEDAGGDLDRIAFFQAPADDAWVRDHGPLTVLRNRTPVLLDFRFNGWGNKYDASEDDQLTRRLHAAGAFGDTGLDSMDFVLEGGSIETDGVGTLMTTTSCLLSPQRNPGWSREDIDQLLRTLLGAERVLWLEHGGLAGDDTDGHIDTLARFCDPHTIAWQGCEDEADEHHATLRAMGQELAAFRTMTGQPYNLVELPLPAPKHDEDGKRLPASYANFLIINDAVLVPAYDDPADAVAAERLRPCFPGRDIVLLDGLPIVHQYGSLHCVTMQLPEGVCPAT
jgi:agmatine deiminase